MTDKERLEEIKKILKFTLSFLNRKSGNTQLIEDIIWLIEQAERVEELELEINDWRAEVQKWQQFYEESEESHLETKELLKSIVNQNKRYREALNTIIKLWIASTDATDDTWLAHEMNETTRKALRR